MVSIVNINNGVNNLHVGIKLGILVDDMLYHSE